MNSHKRVQSMRAGRALLVGRLLEEDWTAAAAALAAGVFRRTAYKWLRRFKIDGPARRLDRNTPSRRLTKAWSAEQVPKVKRRSTHDLAAWLARCGGPWEALHVTAAENGLTMPARAAELGVTVTRVIQLVAKAERQAAAAATTAQATSTQ